MWVSDDYDLQRALQFYFEDLVASEELFLRAFRLKSEMFAEYNFRQFLKGKSSSQGSAIHVRIAENGGSGSFNYINSNGIIVHVNFRYNKDTQKPLDVIGMLVGSLNWIANSNQSEYLKTFSIGNSINVDVSVSGEDLGKIYGYEFVGGMSTYEFAFKGLPEVGGSSSGHYNAKEDAKYDRNWLYIASEYMDKNYRNAAHGYFLLDPTNAINQIITDVSSDNYLYYNFQMIFSHEFKHSYDSIFSTCSILRESSAINFTRNIMNYYNPNSYYYDFHLNNQLKLFNLR